MSLILSNLFKSAFSKANSTGTGLYNGFCGLQQQSSRGLATQKHKRIVKMAKGYRGRANRTFKAALQRVEKALQYAYRDRKQKKRDFRKLWIERINAGARQHDMSYSRFISYMNKSGKFELNRKVLADLAANEPFSFKAVIDTVKVVGRKP